VNIFQINTTDGCHHLGCGWSLAINQDDSVVSRFCDGPRIRADIPTLHDDGPEYDGVAFPMVVLLAGETAYSLILIDDKGLSDAVDLYRRRELRRGHYRQSFVAVSQGVLFVYEGGLIRFASDGKMLWRIDHDRLDWFFVECAADKIWYESEHEGKWAYRLEDGQRCFTTDPSE
jgi:hypothetical protein